MYTVNPELISLAKARLQKTADAMPPMDPSAMGGAPPAAAPMDPSAMGGAPPMDPAAMGAAAPAAPVAPAAPAAPASPTQAANGAGAKLKPEQMMNMLDYRLYNMQQQLTAIMNALGVQVPPESLVLPPGSPGAPPAESALPGGPMAPPPPQQDPNAPPGPQPPGGPLPPGGPGGDPSAMGGAPPDAGKAANWWARAEDYNKAASYIGRPVDRSVSSLPVDLNEPTDMQTKANAMATLFRSLSGHAR